MEATLRPLALALAPLLAGCHTDGAGCGDDTDACDSGDETDVVPVDTDGDTLTLRTLVDGEQADAVLVAVQLGDGAWTVVEGGGGLYTVDHVFDRYGLAVVCPEGPNARRDVVIRHATLAEASTHVVRCVHEPAFATVSGTVAGLSTGEFAWVYGSVDSGSANTVDPTYDLRAEDGRQDLVTVAYDPGSVPTKVAFVRDRIVSGDTTVDVDLASGVVPEVHGLRVDGATGGELVFGSSWFHSHLGSVATLSSTDDSYASVPADALFGNDVHEVFGAARDVVADTVRSQTAWVRTGADLVVALPDVPPAPLVGVEATTPYVRPSVAADVPAGVDGVELQFSQVAEGTTRIWYAALSAGWRGGASVDYALPDLGGLEGFDPAWGLVVGESVDWFARTRSSTGGYALVVPQEGRVGDGPPPAELAGTVEDEVLRAGELVP